MTTDKFTLVKAQLGTPVMTMVLPGYGRIAWWTPVCDRTMADCVYGNPKGCLDAPTVNRIEADAEFLYGVFTNLYIPCEYPVIHPYAFIRDNFFRINNFQVVTKLISNVYEAGIVNASTPAVPVFAVEQSLTLEDVNAIEQILADIYTLIFGIQNNMLMCGPVIAGTDRVAQYIRRA